MFITQFLFLVPLGCLNVNGDHNQTNILYTYYVPARRICTQNMFKLTRFFHLKYLIIGYYYSSRNQWYAFSYLTYLTYLISSGSRWTTATDRCTDLSLPELYRISSNVSVWHQTLDLHYILSCHSSHLTPLCTEWGSWVLLELINNWYCVMYFFYLRCLVLSVISFR